MNRQKFDSSKPIRYEVSEIKGMKEYTKVLDAVSEQLGRDFDHKYDGEQGVVLFTTDVEIDTSRLSKSGLAVKASQ